MTVRLPHSLAGRIATQTPQNALDYELAHEMASTLGRLGRQLETALAELSAFDAKRPESRDPAPDQGTRAALVARASIALWHFIVQRESVGLRDSARVLRDYRVPNEVHDRMGVFPPPK